MESTQHFTGLTETTDGSRLALTAHIVALPTAAAEPVQQPPRRGRLPKAVLLLWRARLDRSSAMRVIKLTAQLEMLESDQSSCVDRYVAAAQVVSEAQLALQKSQESAARIRLESTTLGQRIESVRSELREFSRIKQ